MNRTPISVTMTIGLVAINAAFWLGYAILVALGAVRGIPATDFGKWSLAILAAGCAVALAGTAFFMRRRSRLAFYFGCALLAIIAVLSITDQVGLIDLFTLLISLVALGLMLKDRAWYLNKGGAA